MKNKIDEKLLIELYNAGKNDIELADLFGCSERTIQRCLTRLRNQHKIKLRKDLTTSPKDKTRFKHEEVLTEDNPTEFPSLVTYKKSIGTFLPLVSAMTYLGIDNSIVLLSEFSITNLFCTNQQT